MILFKHDCPTGERNRILPSQAVRRGASPRVSLFPCWPPRWSGIDDSSLQDVPLAVDDMEAVSQSLVITGSARIVMARTAWHSPTSDTHSY